MRKCLLLACCLLPSLMFAGFGVYVGDGCYGLDGTITMLRQLPDGEREYYVEKEPTRATLTSWYGNGICAEVPAEVDAEYSVGGAYIYNQVHTFYFPGLPVVEVSSNVFNGKGVVEVRLPDSISTMGDRVFYQCTSLASVHLPDSLLSIGQSMFSGCTSLASVALPDSLSSIGSAAFQNCTSLESVNLPDSLSSIGAFAFNGCTSLASVALPDKITDVKEQTFSECLSLKTIVIPNAVKSISHDAFDGCEKITTVTIPARFRMSEVFPNSYRIIKSVTIVDGSTSICPFAFHECRQLTSVIIPEGVTEIGESAFENCRNLESVTIPQSVKRIGMCAFYGCISLKEVKYLGEEPEIGKAAFAGTALASGQTVEMLINSANVHYVLNSIKPEFAVPLSEDTGFRNIITEIKGGAVSIPSTWSSNYANFEKKFGADFTKALMKPTGKIGGDGKELMVWQDYVAGTDPTDEKDVFTASVTVVDGKVVVSYSPELDDERKAVRKYTTWGKQKLQDAEWTEVPPGQEGNYNFFKVSVEMK